MGKKKSFIKNAGVLFLGKVFTQFLSFLLLPLYTAFLTAAEYGVVDLTSTYITLIMPLFSLQIERAVFRFLIDKRGDGSRSKEIVTAAVRFMTFAIIAFSSLYFIAWLLLQFNNALFIYIYCVAYLVLAVFLQIARGYGKNGIYAIASCLLGVATIVCNVVLVAMFRLGVRGMLISFDIAYVVSALFLVLYFKNEIVLEDNRKRQKNVTSKLLKYSIPLIPDAISWWVLNVSDRSILTIVLGDAANGIYAVSNKFSTLFIGGFNIINMAWQESVALAIGKDDDFICDMTNSIFCAFSYICAVALCVIPIIFSIMVDGSYSESYSHVPILLVGALFTVGLALLQSIYIGLKQTKKVAKTSTYCAALNIVINLVLINYIGVYAASISTLCSYAALFVYRYIDLKKIYCFKLKIKMIILPASMVFASCLLYYLALTSVAYIVSAVLMVIIAVIVNINTMKKIKIIIMKKRINAVAGLDRKDGDK